MSRVRLLADTIAISHLPPGPLPRLIPTPMNELLRSDMIRGTGSIACQMENSMMVKLQFLCIHAR